SSFLSSLSLSSSRPLRPLHPFPTRRSSDLGVHSAMSSAQALKRCPELVILPPKFDKYRAISKQIMAIYRRYTELIEPLSLDEARSEEHTSELQSRFDLVCRLLLEKKKNIKK